MTTVRERYFADMRAIGQEMDPARLAAEVEKLRADVAVERQRAQDWRDAAILADQRRAEAEQQLVALRAELLERDAQAAAMRERLERAEQLLRGLVNNNGIADIVRRLIEVEAFLAPDAAKEPTR